jgi:capsular polysaccharide biosynthesis protein
MELREYLRILRKYWWMIGLFTLLALVISLNISYSRPPVYESISTYAVGLQPFESASSEMYGWDIMLRNQQRILLTYCQIVMSNAVRQESFRIMNVPNVERGQYAIMCNVLPDTNILRLIVQGQIPAVVTRLNEAIGTVSIERTRGLYSFFPLHKVDSAQLNETPISPNVQQNATMGTAFGLIMGVVLALLLEYLRSPSADQMRISQRIRSSISPVGRSQ